MRTTPENNDRSAAKSGTPLSPVSIRKALLDAATSQAAIAASVTPPITRKMVNAVIQGRSASPWVRRLIAERLGKSYSEVWGESDPGTVRGGRVTTSLDMSSDARAAS